MKNLLVFTFCFFLFNKITTAQKFQNIKTLIKVITLPSHPLSKEIKTFTTEYKIAELSPGLITREHYVKDVLRFVRLEGYAKVEKNGDILLYIEIGASQVRKQKLNEIVKEKKEEDGTVSKSIKYRYSFESKHSIKLTVTNRVTNEILWDEFMFPNDWVPSETVDFKSKKEAEEELPKQKNYVRDVAISETISKCGRFIGSWYGFPELKIKESLKGVKKHKKNDYSDFNTAVQNLSKQLISLSPKIDYLDDENSEAIRDAISQIQIFLDDVDVKNKKARVNSKIASVGYRNMAIGLIYLNDFEGLDSMLRKVSYLSLTKVPWFGKIRDRGIKRKKLRELNISSL